MNLTLLPRDKYQSSYRTLIEAHLESMKPENQPKFQYFRDSVVQRFEYTVEAGWKYLKVLLEENDGIDDLLSPKKVIQEAMKYGYIESIESWYEMLTARNITSHDYGIHHSEHVYEAIDTYISSLTHLYDASLN
jgi:nucleotidyltransferase substrate binding protein (TIGR01987 family)